MIQTGIKNNNNDKMKFPCKQSSPHLLHVVYPQFDMMEMFYLKQRSTERIKINTWLHYPGISFDAGYQRCTAVYVCCQEFASRSLNLYFQLLRKCQL